MAEMIRKDIKIRQLADGTQLNVPVFHFPGQDKSAPSAYIQSSIHAAEVQGYAVALNLIEHFLTHTAIGDVTIVPLANPYALNSKFGEYTAGRFDLVTGDNWNRNYLDLNLLAESFLNLNYGISFEELIPLFKRAMQITVEQELTSSSMSYHRKLALELQRLACIADIVLDLHCDTISAPHIYSPTHTMTSAAQLGVPFIVEIPVLFKGALDEAIFCPWIAMTEQFNKFNPGKLQAKPYVEAFTIELGNEEEIHLQEANKQADYIINYLYSKVNKVPLPARLEERPTTCKLEHFKTLYSVTGGLVMDTAPIGKERKAGEVLLKISNPGSLDKSLDFHLVTDNSCDVIPISRSATAVVHEGMALMKVMTHYKSFQD